MYFGFGRYNAAEWAHLRPLVHVYKDLRHQFQQTRLLRVPSPDARARLASQQIGGRCVLITIAFGNAQFADWQTRLVRRYVPDALHVIADNSPTPESSAAVTAVAEREGATIFRLPPNPWSGRAAAKSHGLAMTWTWENVIRPGRPEAFGFIDHDIFPTAPADPFADLSGRVIAHGVRRREINHSYLWPGFCFFRFAAVEHCALNFAPCYRTGGETGGSLWLDFYRHLSPEQVVMLDFRAETPVPGATANAPGIQWHGEWMHILQFPNYRFGKLDENKLRHAQDLLSAHLNPDKREQMSATANNES